VLGQLSWEHEAHSSLDLAGAQSALLVVPGQLASLNCDALEHIIDEGVHDGHAPFGDASVWVHLLEHLVDVRRVGLCALALALLGVAALLRSLDSSLAGGLACGLASDSHGDKRGRERESKLKGSMDGE
jgi:hypothetical protein